MEGRTLVKAISNAVNLTKHTSLYDGGLIAGADRQHFEHSAGGPQGSFLVGVGPHDVDQSLRPTTGQDYQLEGKEQSGGVRCH